jgi:hypothetical protein
MADRRYRLSSLVLGLVLALGPSLLPSPAVAGPARRVKMRVLRLDDAPKEWTARRLLVGVSIGAREIYRTPAETKPDWDKGFRVQTSRGHPVEFAVVGTSCASPGTADDTAKARRAPQRKGHGDDSLETGMDDLVADYGTGTLDEGAGPDRRPARAAVAGACREKVLCRASLAWKPEPGEHKVPCGAATLVVTVPAK